MVTTLFFSIRVSFTDTGDSQDSKGKKETIFYSTLPPPLVPRSDKYLQLCMWDDHYIFLIVTLLFTRLLLDETYHLNELPFDWLIDWLMMHWLFICLLDDLTLGSCYSKLARETGGFELASTILLHYKRTDQPSFTDFFTEALSSHWELGLPIEESSLLEVVSTIFILKWTRRLLTSHRFLQLNWFS